LVRCRRDRNERQQAERLDPQGSQVDRATAKDVGQQAGRQAGDHVAEGEAADEPARSV
jgi:hypothetical protein